MGQWDWAIDDYNAALRINPMLASSLYGRGLAKLKKGDPTGGNADIAAAKAIEANIVAGFRAPRRAVKAERWQLPSPS
jgi:hypothetical protein